MGPYCRFCDNRCFVHTPDNLLRLGKRKEIYMPDIMATCDEGKKFDKEKCGYNIDDKKEDEFLGGMPDSCDYMEDQVYLSEHDMPDHNLLRELRSLLKDNWKEKTIDNPQDYIWTMKSGREVKVGEMHDNHLRRSFEMIKRRLSDQTKTREEINNLKAIYVVLNSEKNRRRK